MAGSERRSQLARTSGGREEPATSATDFHLLPWAEVDPNESLSLLLANREHLSRWEPLRPDSYFTASGQAELLSTVQQAVRAGREHVAGIVVGGRLVGRVALTGIERGVFQSCHLGYWVGAEHGGRGHATRAVSEVVHFAFVGLELHRVQAAVMPANAASLRVLKKCRFRSEGLAEAYLNIQGRWEDHLIYARTAD